MQCTATMVLAKICPRSNWHQAGDGDAREGANAGRGEWQGAKV